MAGVSVLVLQLGEIATVAYRVQGLGFPGLSLGFRVCTGWFAWWWHSGETAMVRMVVLRIGLALPLATKS